MRKAIRTGLAASLDGRLVDELLDAYDEAKRAYFLGGNRLSEVEGGRFCEAAFRLLQQAAFGKFDALGKQLESQKTIRALEAAATAPDSIRLHIPRALRVIYDVRNKRDAAHLADDIDPNVQDSTLVVSVLDWVTAEFVRLYHKVSPEDAQAMVETLVTRTAPTVQDFDGFLKVLKPGLRAGDHTLLLLYQRGANGATFDELSSWATPSMRANLRRTLDSMVHQKKFVHFDGMQYIITRAGQHEVEARRLVSPA